MDLYPPTFTMQNVMGVTGWDTEEYKSRRTELVDLMKSRWASSRDVNLADLRNFLQSNIGPHNRDLAWFDRATPKRIYSVQSRERQRVQWYLRWATYIKGQSTWDASFDALIMQPAKPAQLTESTDSSRSNESVQDGENLGEDALDDGEPENIQAYSPKRSMSQAIQSTNAQPMHCGDSSSYRWYAGYLHIKFAHCSDFKTIVLGLLIPEGFGMNCSYLLFKHEDLLRRLEKSEVIRPGESNFRLMYQRAEREFDLADEQGYLCALGDFSRQPGALQHTFQPMFVTLQMDDTSHEDVSIGRTKRTHSDLPVGDSNEPNGSADCSRHLARNNDQNMPSGERWADVPKIKVSRWDVKRSIGGRPLRATLNVLSDAILPDSTKRLRTSNLQQAGFR